MTENIAGRVKRIISGGIDALVSTVENAAPVAVMEQAIAEVDQAIDDVRADIGRLIAQKHLIGKELAAKNGEHEDLAERTELAIQQSRDDLAEAAVSRQMDIEAQIPILEHDLAETGEKEKELEGYILALQAKRREMEVDLKAALAAERDEASMGAPVPAAAVADRSVTNASRAFERAMSAKSGVSLDRDHDVKAQASLRELDEMARQNRVRERLEAVKARIGAE